jgi:hypothetical protein
MDLLVSCVTLTMNVRKTLCVSRCAPVRLLWSGKQILPQPPLGIVELVLLMLVWEKLN